MKKYYCDAGECTMAIEADSANEAAEEYAGGYEPQDKTLYLGIRVWAAGCEECGADLQWPQAGCCRSCREPIDYEVIDYAIDPEEPACEGSAAHDWQSPIEVVGGCRENPGVLGHGGGVIITEVCARCGAYRKTDTWAQDRETGRQGLHSVSYNEADERSREWVSESA